MSNPLYLILLAIDYYDPLILYLFIGAIAAGTAFTYLYRLRIGLMTTILMSAFFFSIGFTAFYVYIPLIVSIVLLFAEVFDFKNLGRRFENSINWLYLYYRSKRSKKPKQAVKNL